MIPVLLLAACSAPPPPEVAVVALSAEPTTLLPLQGTTLADEVVGSALFEPNLWAHLDCRLRFEPGAFAQWAAEGSALRVDLRPDAAWSDGTPVGAGAYKLAWAFASHPASGSRYGLDAAAFAAPVEQAGPGVLRFRFAGGEPASWLPHVTLPPVPAHRLGDTEVDALRAHPLAREPLTTGPFRLEHWHAGDRLVLSATRPELVDRLVFRVLPDQASQVAALLAGDVDAVVGLSPGQAAEVARRRPEVRLYRRPSGGLDYLGWRLVDEDGAPHALFGDIRVRRALAKAVDVPRLMRALADGDGPVWGTPATSTLHPGLCDLGAPIPPIEVDAGAARAELAAAGWSDGDGDGVLDRDGRRFAFSLLVPAGHERRETAAVILQADLRAVGVEATIERAEGNAFAERLLGGRFEAVLAGWKVRPVPELASRWRSGTRLNVVGYASEEVDALLEGGEASLGAAAARIYADQPYLFLYWVDEIVAVHGRFEGVEPDALSVLGDLGAWRVAGP